MSRSANFNHWTDFIIYFVTNRASCKSVISAINQVKNELHGQARGIVFLEKDICHRSRQ